MTKLGGLYTLT